MSAVATVPPHKVLVANRGEIAVRIIRACHEYGFASVAVYADPDVDSLHCRRLVKLALPGSSPAETYLNIEQLIDVARRSEATMVHPGYGFCLSGLNSPVPWKPPGLSGLAHARKPSSNWVIKSRRGKLPWQLVHRWLKVRQTRFLARRTLSALPMNTACPLLSRLPLVVVGAG
ncbi:Acetyl-/propionyl-coenzyme A carboxylase alpha chain [Klebsiella variicola]|nr:Acetyl-/propionyl-coenzyme A carboxylase alpha chain [Klebsiella variicola]